MRVPSEASSTTSSSPRGALQTVQVVLLSGERTGAGLAAGVEGGACCWRTKDGLVGEVDREALAAVGESVATLGILGRGRLVDIVGAFSAVCERCAGSTAAYRHGEPCNPTRCNLSPSSFRDGAIGELSRSSCRRLSLVDCVPGFGVASIAAPARELQTLLFAADEEDTGEVASDGRPHLLGAGRIGADWKNSDWPRCGEGGIPHFLYASASKHASQEGIPAKSMTGSVEGSCRTDVSSARPFSNCLVEEKSNPRCNTSRNSIPGRARERGGYQHEHRLVE